MLRKQALARQRRRSVRASSAACGRCVHGTTRRATLCLRCSSTWRASCWDRCGGRWQKAWSHVRLTCTRCICGNTVARVRAPAGGRGGSYAFAHVCVSVSACAHACVCVRERGCIIRDTVIDTAGWSPVQFGLLTASSNVRCSVALAAVSRQPQMSCRDPCPIVAVGRFYRPYTYAP